MPDSGLCRICADFSDNTSPLFTGSLRKLLAKIKNITGLQIIRIQELPQNICKSCENDILQANIFRDRCIRAQAGFKTLCTQNIKGTRKRKKKKKRKSIYDNDDDMATIKEEIVPPIEVVLFNETNEFKAEKEEQTLLDVNSSDSLNLSAHYNQSKDDIVGGETLVIEPNKNLITAENPLSNIDDNIKISDRDTSATETENISMLTHFPINNELIESQKKQTTTVEVREKRDYRVEHTWICDLCGKHFTVKNNFKMHMLRHSDIKPFPCKLCPKGYYSNSDLIRHSLRHTGEKPHPCKFCDRTFYDKSHLLRHTRGEHTMERPFACNQCPKEFLTSYSLKCHLTTHSGVRAFPCKLCQTSYKTYSARCEHYRSAMHKQKLAKQETSSDNKTTDISKESKN